MTEPLAIHEYHGLPDGLKFLKRTRSEMRALRRVCVWVDRLQVVDVNKDIFEIRGVGYPDPDVVPLLNSINAVYNPIGIHDPIKGLYKEFSTGRRYPWGRDRVM